MSCARKDSSQCSSPATGAAASSSTTSSSDGALAAHRGDDQRAEHADADEGDDPADAAGHGDRKLAPPGPDEAEQRANGRRPADLGRVLRQVAHHDAGLFRRRGIGRAQGRRAAAASSPRSASCGPISRRYGPSRAISSAWRPLSDHGAVVQHQDAIGVDHAGQPVRQDQRGAARPSAGPAPAGSPPRSPRPPRTAPRPAPGSARRAAARGRWRCAGAGRRTGARRVRRSPSGSRRAAPR